MKWNWFSDKNMEWIPSPDLWISSRSKFAYTIPSLKPEESTQGVMLGMSWSTIWVAWGSDARLPHPKYTWVEAEQGSGVT
jgi:hypothetical protein